MIQQKYKTDTLNDNVIECNDTKKHKLTKLLNKYNSSTDFKVHLHNHIIIIIIHNAQMHKNSQFMATITYK